MYKGREGKLDHLDPAAIELLNSLDCNIVISSTWRKIMSIERLREMFEIKGYVKNQIVDITPSFDYPSAVRGNEIAEWLRMHVRGISDGVNYAILDDDSDFLLVQRNNFFHVDAHFGLSPNHIYKINRFFCGKPTCTY